MESNTCKQYNKNSCEEQTHSHFGALCNETLRSHMFRIHNISRMFMCRCCNWAFSDKTSLHIHMQSMLRNGTPGEVAILARSSTEGTSIQNFRTFAFGTVFRCLLGFRRSDEHYGRVASWFTFVLNRDVAHASLHEPFCC
ncbi:unnamed protein product [Heligmosomoides polygyrus]|uniref:C2H2-type domain-containing protein n=1 Tax=Heligmosomoides polygyrus TaxID=6339 RepID=A0A183GPE1_HELPZ|nr:unnamed protein product [Heligmosomoides polygyrus]